MALVADLLSAPHDGDVSTISPVRLIGRIFCQPIESVQFAFVALPAAVNQAPVADSGGRYRN